MIFDKIENVGRYVGISENLDKALHYLANNDLSLLQDGKTIIDGDNVFVNAMQATTNPDTEREYEFHEEYYDIQIDIKGTEEVWFGTEYQQLTQPYQKERDIGRRRDKRYNRDGYVRKARRRACHGNGKGYSERIS